MHRPPGGWGVTGRIDPSTLPVGRKAELIYARARSELSSRLWQAALGEGGRDSASQPAGGQGGGNVSLESLLALLARDGAASPAPYKPVVELPVPAPGRDDGLAERRKGDPEGDAAPSGELTGLGANAPHRAALSAAAARTGIPAPALAAIVNAEAAKGADGRWLAYSRNPRSSAAGLGQFLSGTWKDEAQRAGTWLNGVAQARGWLNEHGHVRHEARADLLALRYDPEASIQAVADYARGNLDRMRAAGVQIADCVDGIARAAYVGHHLGVGDAVKFLTGRIDPARARHLLDAQIGIAAAGRRIALAADAAEAHRSWLLNYVERQICPGRFAGPRAAG